MSGSVTVPKYLWWWQIFFFICDSSSWITNPVAFASSCFENHTFRCLRTIKILCYAHVSWNTGSLFIIYLSTFVLVPQNLYLHGELIHRGYLLHKSTHKNHRSSFRRHIKEFLKSIFKKYLHAA